MVKEYFQDCWRELWNPDSRVWQYIDRIAFMFLPLISLTLAIIPIFSNESESWRVMMANLAWIIPLLIWLLVLLVIVPYRVANKYKQQRNEARIQLQKQPKPIPLQNRRELIEAIANIEKTTLEVINLQNSIDELVNKSAHPETAGGIELINARKRATAHWNDSLNLLRREYLIAGDEYEKIAVDFTGFVGLQIMIKTGLVKYVSDTEPVVLQNTLQFAGILASRVKETTQKINNLSGQVLDREGSQI